MFREGSRDDAALVKEGLFDKLEIGIASDVTIRDKWSCGEIKKPETINYRTFKPEKGGCFVKKSLAQPKTGNVIAVNTRKSNTKGLCVIAAG